MAFFLPFLDKNLSKLGKNFACLERLFSRLPFFVQFCRRNDATTEGTGFHGVFNF